jgi:DNA-binding transcriptional ArsR family regulator
VASRPGCTSAATSGNDSCQGESSGTVEGVIAYRFGARDLLRVRFAASPLIEVFASFEALRAPERHPEHEPWTQWARSRLEGADTSLMAAASPLRTGYRPDFINPPPDRPRTTLSRELMRLRRTPRARVARELAWAYPDAEPPAIDLDLLVAQVARYFNRVLAPHWPRIEAAIEAEFSLRGRRLAREGAAAAFSDLHPAVRFHDDALLIDRAYEHHVELGGRGLLLVPSIFVAPDVWAMTDPPWQPSVLYAPPGVAELWAPPARDREAALAGLLGRRRAEVLAGLATPVSTLDLAARLRASPAGVSAHLKALREAGLVLGRREGRAVLYARTPLGDALLRPDRAATPGGPG